MPAPLLVVDASELPLESTSLTVYVPLVPLVVKVTPKSSPSTVLVSLPAVANVIPVIIELGKFAS